METYIQQDTIVAPATAPGMAAIAVIRLSGPEAVMLAEGIFAGRNFSKKNLAGKQSHSLHFGIVHDGDLLIDEVLLSLFFGPNSYTGEDVVEISCHGSSFIQQQIIQLLVKRGARPARPGEFTLRAFLNRKMDLSQAEAVAELIASTSAGAHRIALQQMRGGFSNRIKDLREQLLNFASLIELELDFSEEDVEFANRDELKKLVMEIIRSIEKLSASFEAGNVIREGVPVTIAGKPNAGKSTLLNALLEEDRAIVSEIPGTTRDSIEDVLHIEGMLFRFIDTAGIRETVDLIESAGVSRTYEKIRQSSVVIYLFDAAESNAEELLQETAQLRTQMNEGSVLLMVANKTDKLSAEELHQKFSGIEDLVYISARERQNLHSLNERLLQAVKAKLSLSDDTIVSNIRHADALNKTAEALQRAFEGLNSGLSGDLLASDIRQALHYLGLITGEITTEDLLGNIFGRFCIGK